AERRLVSAEAKSGSASPETPRNTDNAPSLPSTLAASRSARSTEDRRSRRAGTTPWIGAGIPARGPPPGRTVAGRPRSSREEGISGGLRDQRVGDGPGQRAGRGDGFDDLQAVGRGQAAQDELGGVRLPEPRRLISLTVGRHHQDATSRDTLGERGQALRRGG